MEVFSANDDDFNTRRVADHDQIEQFVTALFTYAESGYVQLRCFSQNADKPAFYPWRAIPAGDLNRVIDGALLVATRAANNGEAVVFCPPVATFTDPKQATKLHIAEGVALSVDCDDVPEEKIIRLINLLGVPTVRVASGGVWVDDQGEAHDKTHLHWRLQEPTRTLDDHRRLEEARRLATIYVGADLTNVPLTHPLRWPGSWHRKNDARLCAITEINASNETDLGEALDLLRDACGIEFGEAIVKTGDRTVTGSANPDAVARSPDDVTAVRRIMSVWEPWCIGRTKQTPSGCCHR
jgi:hypothetical protein